jgi:hypothetical protein
MTLQVQAQKWHDADLTALGGGPNTASPNAVIYDLNVGVIRSHYIADHHVHELSLNKADNKWADNDLSALGGATVDALGDIALLYDPNTNVVRSHYIATDNHVHELNLDQANTKWTDNDLSALGGATVTALRPVALVYGGVPSVIRSHYIGSDNHVHELFLDANGWHDGDLSAQGGATVTAVGPIASLYDPNVNAIRIHYMASDNHVHELALSTIITGTLAWVDGDLTAQAGATVNTLGPIALLYDPKANVVRSHYLASDNHVHELSLLGKGSGWQDGDLTALGGGPNAVGRISNRYDPNQEVIRSHYIGSDNHVHELFLDANGWHDGDLSAQGGATVTALGPIAIVYDPNFPAFRSHYVGSDNHVHELGLY